MTWRAKTVMFCVINIFMASAMSITADLMNTGLSARTLLMMLIGFTVGMGLSFLIPYHRMSAWSCRLFRVRSESFIGNLVGNILPAICNTTIISAVMTAINVSPMKLGPAVYADAYFSTLWLLEPVGYIVACFATPLASAMGGKVERYIQKNRKGDDAK